MFEELDLHIADGKENDAPAYYSQLCTHYLCSGNRCSNSSCAGTSLRFCC